MTLLIWLAATSLLWGAVLWMSGRILQHTPSVSGRARQWIWRGATLLLIAPWIAAPFILMFGLGLAPAETVAEAAVAVAPMSDHAAMHALDAAHIETTVIEGGGTLWSALGAMNIAELALLAIVAGWLVRFVMAQIALRKLLGIVMLSRSAEAGAATDAVRKWTSRLKLRQAPHLRMVAEQHSPFSYGILRPTVCLPEGLDSKLSRQSLDLVVGHECVHVARGDGWLRPLERVAADVLWFNPFAWLIRRELDVARELAVDEAVVAMADARIAYARALRDVAGISAGLPAAVPAASMALAGGRSLMLRVSRTLAQARTRTGRAAIIAASLFGLIAAPVAIAQVIMVVPAPAAPEAPVAPEAPNAPALLAALEAPEVPEVPEAPESPPAPEAPKTPPSAAFASPDGSVRATFPARVVGTSGDATTGYRVELLQIAPGETGETCLADMRGFGALNVAPNQMVKRGDVVGQTRKSGQMSFSVACSDELDGAGRPKVGPTPAPPAPPPAPRSHVSAVAPVAPVAPESPPAPAPAPLAAPSPVAPAAPAVAPAPPAPRVWDGRQTPQTPQTPMTPLTPTSLQGETHPVVGVPGRNTSPYGERRDPFTNQRAFHSGVDVAAHRGATIHTPAKGTVVRAENVNGYGNLVEVALTDGYVLRMGQLDEIKVVVGDALNTGDVVGTMGSSGPSTGPHLHLEVLVDGKQVDPQQVKGLVLASPLAK